MMAPSRTSFATATRRITWTAGVLGASGTLILFAWRGWRWALAYALGAAASFLNFHWLHRVVESLGAKLAARRSPKFAILIGLRYLLLGAGAYVIVNFTTLSLSAALIGLFVPVAAVILEIVFELIYGA